MNRRYASSSSCGAGPSTTLSSGPSRAGDVAGEIRQRVQHQATAGPLGEPAPPGYRQRRIERDVRAAGDQGGQNGDDGVGAPWELDAHPHAAPDPAPPKPPGQSEGCLPELRARPCAPAVLEHDCTVAGQPAPELRDDAGRRRIEVGADLPTAQRRQLVRRAETRRADELIGVVEHRPQHGEGVFGRPLPVLVVGGRLVEVEHELEVGRAVPGELQAEQVGRVGRAGMDPLGRGRQVAERAEASASNDVDHGLVVGRRSRAGHRVAQRLQQRAGNPLVQGAEAVARLDRNVDREDLHHGADERPGAGVAAVVDGQPE